MIKDCWPSIRHCRRNSWCKCRMTKNCTSAARKNANALTVLEGTVPCSGRHNPKTPRNLGSVSALWFFLKTSAWFSPRESPEAHPERLCSLTWGKALFLVMTAKKQDFIKAFWQPLTTWEIPQEPVEVALSPASRAPWGPARHWKAVSVLSQRRCQFCLTLFYSLLLIRGGKTYEQVHCRFCVLHAGEVKRYLLFFWILCSFQ